MKKKLPGPAGQACAAVIVSSLSVIALGVAMGPVPDNAALRRELKQLRRDEGRTLIKLVASPVLREALGNPSEGELRERFLCSGVESWRSLFVRPGSGAMGARQAGGAGGGQGRSTGMNVCGDQLRSDRSVRAWSCKPLRREPM